MYACILFTKNTPGSTIRLRRKIDPLGRCISYIVKCLAFRKYIHYIIYFRYFNFRNSMRCKSLQMSKKKSINLTGPTLGPGVCVLWGWGGWIQTPPTHHFCSWNSKQPIYTPVNERTLWSKYMAQSLKGRLIHGLYQPIHGKCAIYFYPGVAGWNITIFGRRYIFISGPFSSQLC